MEKINYKLPLDIGKLFSESGGHMERCSELESIDQHIGLLLITHRGEHGFNQQYGTKLWEMDFENITSRAAWESKFVGYIRRAVTAYEKRIKEVEVTIDVNDMVHEEASMKGYSVRKRVDVIIIATVISTNKRHGFQHVIDEDFIDENLKDGTVGYSSNLKNGAPYIVCFKKLKNYDTVITHEILHALELAHPFDAYSRNTPFSYRFCTTNNVMDYSQPFYVMPLSVKKDLNNKSLPSDAPALFHWQWQIINPQIQ